MTARDDERPSLEREEQEFVNRLAASYAPPLRTPARRAAWDAALWARLEGLERRRRWWLWVPPALAGAAVAAWLWLALPVPFQPEPGRTQPSALAWEDELFLASALGQFAEPEDVEFLPDEYLAMASAFLGP